MNAEKLKRQIGANISSYRKQMGWTQLELAEKLNYSDKAVSKWERGESVPDVLTLAAIAEQIGTTLDDLLKDPNALPEETGSVQQVMGKVVEKTLKRKADKRIIQCLCSTLVWFIALFIYVVLSSLPISNSWMAFIYAIPANAVVLISLRSAWKDFRWNRTLISAIMWGSILSLHLSLLVLLNINLWKLYLLGVPGQIAILLWVKMFRAVKDREESNG